MSEIGNFLKGRSLLTNSPFRSWNFRVVSAVCTGALSLTAYIIWRHWHVLNANAVILLSVFIGIQLFYQWWRAVRYYGRIRELYAEAAFEQPRDGSSLDVALRVAAEGISDLLFYHFGMVLVCLCLIDILLFRLDGLK